MIKHYIYKQDKQQEEFRGLSYSVTDHGRSVCFHIQVIGDGKKHIEVRMEPDSHKQPHVHINRHGASFSIRTGQRIVGSCDARSEQIVRDWILLHRNDLLDLWEKSKRGANYNDVLGRIETKMCFGDFGFNGEEPENRIDINKIIIWYNGTISEVSLEEMTKYICDKEIYVAFLPGSNREKVTFESKIGKVETKSVG